MTWTKQRKYEDVVYEKSDNGIAKITIKRKRKPRFSTFPRRP